MSKDPKHKNPAPGKYVYDYPRPMLTADTVVLAELDGKLNVLLIRRKYPPYQGCWALPGGYVARNEQALSAARRELAEETGLKGIKLRTIGFFDTPGRDPRGWTVSVVHLGFADPHKINRLRAGDDAQDIAWRRLDTRVKLAFDHNLILRHAARWMSNHRLAARVTSELGKKS